MISLPKVGENNGEMNLFIMASERECFDLTGPLHLTSVDWDNHHHRRSVAASLVQGVYILERDRQEKRFGPEALAPPWWLFLQFELVRPLIDNIDSSIIGAVYEYKSPNNQPQNVPRHVVAFRGTMTKKDSIAQDIKLDLHIIRNRLHETCRVEVAMQAVRSVVAAFPGPPRVLLAGHSLGSAIAMVVGKNMAKTGVFLESFLFNPPYLAPPIEKIKNPKLKIGLRFASSLISAGVTAAVKGPNLMNRDHQFAALASWVPNLFVNLADHLCAEYVGYFEHRKRMEDIGAGAIEKLANQYSIGALFSNSRNGNGGDDAVEPLHLIPSANLVISLSPCPDFKSAHGIHQWWRPDLQLQSNVYRYEQ